MVLLAAGLGTRLASVTGGLPKILTKIGGRTLLDRQLAYLAAAGLTEVIVNLHYRAGDVLAYLARRRWPVAVRASVEAELLGTAGALLPLRPLLDRTFVVLYGDVLTDIPLRRVLDQHAASGAIATICCHIPHSWAGQGVIEVDAAGRITRFTEKPACHVSGYANAGVYVLEPQVINAVPGTGSDFGFHVFPRLLASGAHLTAFPAQGLVLDVGTPEGLERAEALARAARLP